MSGSLLFFRVPDLNQRQLLPEGHPQTVSSKRYPVSREVSLRQVEIEIQVLIGGIVHPDFTAGAIHPNLDRNRIDGPVLLGQEPGVIVQIEAVYDIHAGIIKTLVKLGGKSPGETPGDRVFIIIQP